MQLLARKVIRVEIAVAGQTVEAMQFQMLVEGALAKKFFQRGLLHAVHIGEPHVIVDQRQDLIGVVVGETQTSADFGGHFYSYFYVAIEADAVGRYAEGWGLAYVVEERSPG